MIRSWLYVPGDRPDRVTKALDGQADAVVIDLEDAVADAAKATARRTTLHLLASRRAHVRINDPRSPRGERDLAELAEARCAGLAGVRVPKCADAATVASVADTLDVPVYPIIESALGVERAFDLILAHPHVAGVSLGEADLAADLGTSDPGALDWPRSRVIVAARAAGLPSPPQSVWTAVRDLDGLRASTEAGRRAGFFGRSVIHPAQIPVVHDACAPGSSELTWARELLASLSASDEPGGAWVDAHGRFVDKAIVRRAQDLLSIAPTDHSDEGRHP